MLLSVFAVLPPEALAVPPDLIPIFSPGTSLSNTKLTGATNAIDISVNVFSISFDSSVPSLPNIGDDVSS